MTSEPGKQGKWKEYRPSDRAWKRRKGVSPSAEQDRAAGGRNRRKVQLEDGRYATASVALKLQGRSRRIRAVLRWSDQGKSPERYLGEVDCDTRAANLVSAWGLARAAGYLAEDLPDNSWASSAATRAVMQGNRGQDTKPELLLRSLLHKRGLRYRVGERPLPELSRRADVVFRRERVAIFVDGCFWHGCPEHLRPARKNASFWSEKIAGNKKRDSETNAALTQAGWVVVRVWEHDDPAKACERISELVQERRADSKNAA